MRCKDRGCCSCNEKKTKKVLQQDYENLYTGPTMLLADRYSSIIATTFIILLYSLSMPFLYIAGFLIFSSMYITDKVLFLRYQRTPPKYTTELARRTYFLLEWAIILHFIFGLFMISNPKIFSFESSQINPSIEWATPLTEFLGKWANTWLGVDENRFSQIHAVIYGIGICIFLILFTLERLLGLVSKVINFITGCITKRTLIVEEFSTNLLKEINFDDLQMEYIQTVQ
jgi:hypothetical protein